VKRTREGGESSSPNERSGGGGPHVALGDGQRSDGDDERELRGREQSQCDPILARGQALAMFRTRRLCPGWVFVRFG
jgi:hypothetical protein